jgi:hypothetical protein
MVSDLGVTYSKGIITPFSNGIKGDLVLPLLPSRE